MTAGYCGYCEGCSHLTLERTPLVMDWETHRRDYCAECLAIIQDDRRQTREAEDAEEEELWGTADDIAEVSR